MQSYLQSQAPLAPFATLRLTELTTLCGPVTRARLIRTGRAYALIFAVAAILLALVDAPALDALALGLMAPGAGFLLWAGPGCAMPGLYLAFSLLSLLAFAGALALWFSTGNVVAPVAVWGLAALAAAAVGASGFDSNAAVFTGVRTGVPLGIVVALVAALLATRLASLSAGRERARLNTYLASIEARHPAEAPAKASVVPASVPTSHHDELSLSDLQLMRLLLDRALQPVDRFDGFEWIDQFQTSAVRYQLNFMSYALSITQARHMPAFTGYLAEAQQNLILKQQDYRIWRYWQLENMWGNFRRLPDPIPHQNIMFTGFLAAQIAFYQAASGSTAHNAPGSLAFRHPSGDRYCYDLPGLVDVLMRGHRQSAFGLIACEPNWVYPLCNAIGTAAIRAYDGTSATAHWAEIEAAFGHRLETEFISPRGRLVPARSSSTGLAVPPIGGAVMQAFPSLFLNATLPDIAERQWLLVRRRLERVGFRRALWPIDVGNYRFSRASSFAATAAAAVELGDNDMAKRLLDGLDEACPMHVTAGVAHRANASLWAHAVEMMARAGAADALRSLASGRRQAAPGPFIKAAAYPDVLVARAFARNGALDAVLYPGRAPGVHALTIAGLSPGQAYRSNLEPDSTIITAIIADRHGDTTIRVPLAGRTVWQLRPVAL